MPAIISFMNRMHRLYHHHGIYQNRNEDRLRNLIRIIGEDPDDSLESTVNPFHEVNLLIGALIPIREEPHLDKEIQEKLLKFTIKEALNSSSINHVYVSTSSKRLANLALKFGAEVPFLRPESLADEKVSISKVLQHALNEFESKGIYFDYLATLEITHPFRPTGIVQRCIEHALRTGLESVVAGMPELRPSWWLESEEFRRIDDFLSKRDEREPIHIGLPAICSVITPSLLRQGRRIGDRVGIVEVTDPLAQIEIRKNEDVNALSKLNEFSLKGQ